MQPSKTSRTHFILLFSASIIFSLAFGRVSGAAAAAPAAKGPAYKSAILLEAGTGKILYEYQADEKRIPASIVKMMVMLLTAEAVKKGVLSLDQDVTVSAEASHMGGSQVYLKEGEIFPLGTLLKAVTISSANDASYAIAEHMAGTIEAMVELMNERAKELGMINTRYTNVHGLPPAPSQEQDQTSARDTAILAREIVKHPLILKWTGRWKDTIREGKFTMFNTNRNLLRTFRGMDGIKTGYTKEAGYNLCGTAKRRNLRLISVVLGTLTRKARDKETKKLLLQGFRLFERKTFFAKNAVIGKPVPVLGGKKKTIKVVASGPVSFIVKRLDKSKLKTRVNIQSPLKAPIKKGQQVGEVSVVLKEEVLGQTPLLASEDVKKLSWLDRMKFWKR